MRRKQKWRDNDKGSRWPNPLTLKHNFGRHSGHPKRVKTPLLVLGAEKDWALGPDTKATARAYGAQAEIIPSVSHYMILDPGWKCAAERILSWLREKGI